MVRDLKGRLWDVERRAGTWEPATKGMSDAELNHLADRFGTPGGDTDGLRWAASLGGPTKTIPPGIYGVALGEASSENPDTVLIGPNDWPADPGYDPDRTFAIALPRDGIYSLSAFVSVTRGPGATTIPHVFLWVYDAHNAQLIAGWSGWDDDVYDPHPPEVNRANALLARAAVGPLPAGSWLALVAGTRGPAEPVNVTPESFDVAYVAPPPPGWRYYPPT
jgi:hypothetical protein